MDTVYVIYFDGHMHKERNRQCVYLEKKNAEQVITEEAKGLIYDMAKEDGKSYWGLSDEEWDKYLEKAKQRFEIREFVERK